MKTMNGGQVPYSVSLLSVSMLLNAMVSGALWAVLPTILRSTEQPAFYGRLLGAASALGALSNAALGALSDRHGRRAVFQLAVLLFAACPACLFAGTVIEGAAGGDSSRGALPKVLVFGALLSRQQASQAIAKAHVSDVTPATGRTTALGRLAAFSGVGFVVGPTVGGWLARNDPSARSSLGVCVVLCAANIVLGAVGLRGGGGYQEHEKQAEQQAPPPSAWRAALSLWRDRRIALLLTVQLFLSLGFQSFTCVFAMYCKSRFGFGAARYGNVLSYCGMCWATTQGVLVPWAKARQQQLMQKVGSAGVDGEVGSARAVAALEFSFLRWTTSVLVLGRLTLAAAYTVPLLLLGELLVIVGAGFSFTLTTSLLLAAAPPEHAGRAAGLSSALENLCGIVAPPCVGLLFEAYGDAAGALVAAGFNVVALAIVIGSVAAAAPDDSAVSKPKRE